VRRLVVRGALCGALAAVLAGCGGQATRPAPSPEPVARAPASVPLPEPEPSAAPLLAPATADASPWPQLRRSFALDGCDYRPQVRRWAQHYARSPRAFTASWKAAMPFLLLVVDELERRKLPGEFAMLPYVESTYRPVPGRDGPAGMWQLDADTARSVGLHVGADYDARLDPIASTGAALDLLEHYEREFADWRVADMAFNSGEFRVRKLLGDTDAHALSAADLARLPLSRTTHEHLDRLLALACIVQDPRAFGLVLPSPAPGDRLQALDLRAGMDLRLAARLAGVPYEDVKRWNAGYRRNRMDADFSRRLLLPDSRVAQFRNAAEAVPVAYWGDWREQRATATRAIGSWAAQFGVPIAVLATANAVDVDATILPSTHLLVPGREPAPSARKREDAASRPARHVVVAGDSLSRVAQRYSMTLADLVRLNPHLGTLHPGDVIRLQPPD
jgi:peptidoglycan lytic transglycosylase D